MTRVNNDGVFNQAGFSLLELLITLIIVATLVSVLMPKLGSLQENAHKSYVVLTANSLKSAVNITHNLWLSHGAQGSLNNVTVLKGYGDSEDQGDSENKSDGELNILMSHKGWPVDAIAVGLYSLKNLNANLTLSHATCIRLWRGLLKNSASAPKVGLEKEGLKIEERDMDEGQTDAIFLTQLENGVCRYRYRLNQDGLRIHYDLATGQVITLF